MIDANVVTRKLQIMQECLERLEELRLIPRHEFARDFRNLDSAQHRLQITIEAGFDIIGHIVTQQFHCSLV